MSTTEEVEVERKYAADGIDRQAFYDYMVGSFSLFASDGQIIELRGFDDYYRQGDNVVRHRYGDADSNLPSELTVKCRTSLLSTESRHEIDLPLDIWADKDRVHRFLTLSGWLREVALFKSADIFHVTTEAIPVTVALYDIVDLGGTAPKRRFLEVEADKSPFISQVDARLALKFWENLLGVAWTMDPIPNLSLYELYSGKSYRVVS